MPHLDGVLIYGKTFEEHVKNVEKVLHRLRENGIELDSEKCNFFKREVKYQDWIISKDEYHQKPKNNDALEKFRAPLKASGKRRFLFGVLFGFHDYCCNYVKLFENNETFLWHSCHHKIKKNGRIDSKQSIIWRSLHKKGLEEITNYLKSPEIISYPDFSHFLIIHCDASQKGLGAVYIKKLMRKWKLSAMLLEHYPPLKRIIHLRSMKLKELALKYWKILWLL